MKKLRRIVFAPVAICLLAVPLALGQDGPPPNRIKERATSGKGNKAGGQQAVEKLDDELFAADLKGDAAFFEKNLADDYVRIDAHGEMRNKTETIDRYKSGLRSLDVLDLKKRQVRIFGNTAIVTREDNAKGRVGSNEFTGTYRKTVVYVKEKNGQWLNVNFQSTKVQPR